jgi:hypothetical protein
MKDEGAIILPSPVMCTRGAIKKVGSEPIDGSEELIDRSLLDEDGFLSPVVKLGH